MNTYVSRTARALGTAAILIVASASASAAYPDRPVRVVAPYAPGGGVDFTSRVVTQKLAAALGQTFLIDNRSGAASIIGTQIVAAAQPDGYTLLWTDNAFNVNPLVFKDAKYDALKDFEIIAQIGSAPQTARSRTGDTGQQPARTPRAAAHADRGLRDRIERPRQRAAFHLRAAAHTNLLVANS